jgi:hypothetical protein
MDEGCHMMISQICLGEVCFNGVFYFVQKHLIRTKLYFELKRLYCAFLSH